MLHDNGNIPVEMESMDEQACIKNNKRYNENFPYSETQMNATISIFF
jgi:hypothetical protein